MSVYQIEMFNHGKWWKGPLGSRHFCDGYLYARKDEAPRLAHRIVRSDGKVMDMLNANDDVCIGQIAGWPTAEQYERAGNEALAKAKSIRERQAAKESRP